SLAPWPAPPPVRRIVLGAAPSRGTIRALTCQAGRHILRRQRTRHARSRRTVQAGEGETAMTPTSHPGARALSLGIVPDVPRLPHDPDRRILADDRIIEPTEVIRWPA